VQPGSTIHHGKRRF